jgi:hypothetical protein
MTARPLYPTLLDDRELLAECLEAFDALASSAPSPRAKELLKKRGTPHEPFQGTSAYQLARTMAEAIRQHLAKAAP